MRNFSSFVLVNSRFVQVTLTLETLHTALVPCISSRAGPYVIFKLGLGTATMLGDFDAKNDCRFEAKKNAPVRFDEGQDLRRPELKCEET